MLIEDIEDLFLHEACFGPGAATATKGERNMFSRNFVCSCAAVCTGAAFTLASAQHRDPEARANAAAGTTPVAYIYVSSKPTNSSVNEIVGFAAAGNGKLTPVP